MSFKSARAAVEEHSLFGLQLVRSKNPAAGKPPLSHVTSLPPPEEAACAKAFHRAVTLRKQRWKQRWKRLTSRYHPCVAP